jgi:uncharacterized membrane protein
MANITIQMEKYDPAEVEADIDNINSEIADEDAVNTTLINNNSTLRTELVRKFINDNRERITDQHMRMKTRVKDLHDLVQTNIQLENADSEYKELCESEDAQLIAGMLTELNALSLQYRELLLNTGRAGRPPLF